MYVVVMSLYQAYKCKSRAEPKRNTVLIPKRRHNGLETKTTEKKQEQEENGGLATNICLGWEG